MMERTKIEKLREELTDTMERIFRGEPLTASMQALVLFQICQTNLLLCEILLGMEGKSK